MAPPATGDLSALALADSVMTAMGGRDAWDSVPYVSFVFFGNRLWFWDKARDRFRVESEKRGYRIAGRLDRTQTNLWLQDRVENHPDSLSKYARVAWEAWINDTYWLAMPFKLRDPGVRLTDLGVCQADSSTSARCMGMTFQSVGVTPDNRYKVYIDPVSYQVIRWDYFRHAGDTLPVMSTPWTDYRPYGRIMLSSGRGDRMLSDIALPTVLPDAIFEDVSHPASDILSGLR